MNYLRNIVMTCFLVSLVAPAPSEARVRDKEAHFLSLQFPFMSPQVAQEYVEEYRTQLKACYTGKDGREYSQLCQSQALEAISLSFQESDTYMIYKLNQYKEDGHISFIDYPDRRYPTMGSRWR